MITIYICIWLCVFFFLLSRRQFSLNPGEKENWELLIAMWIICVLFFIFTYAWNGIFEEIRNL